MLNHINKLADSFVDYIVEMRRDFHKYPETGWNEVRTSAVIAEELRKIGLDEVLIGEDVSGVENKMGLPTEEELEDAYINALKTGVSEEDALKFRGGNTGVIGIFRCGDGPEFAMRFDIDALPMKEYSGEDSKAKRDGYISVNHKAMHSCGHDGHAAIGLGVAKVLAEIRNDLRGTIKLIFQPAEEGVRGAKAIVDKGHLDNTDYLLASHITNSKSNEEYDLFVGSGGSFATTKMDIIFSGKSAHAGGSPEKGDNVLLPMASAILNIHGIPRHSEGSTRVHVGVAKGGSGRNIVADHAMIMVETRAVNTEINEYLVDYVKRIAKNSAEMHNVNYEILKVGEAPSLESDIEMMEIMKKVASEISLRANETLRMQLGGSEDVAFMMEKVQSNGGIASFMRLLTPITAVAHNNKYDFDEKVLVNGVKAFSGGAYKLMGRKE